jgi:hypothetical protein
MPDDAPRHLESLTIGRLKSVAERYGVDVGSCKHKKDFVSKLAAAGITEEQVADVTEDQGTPRTAGTPDDELQKDIESIAEKRAGRKVLPAKEDEDVERNIDRVLLQRPSFFEIDSAVQVAWNHMIMADYHDALLVNSETRSRMLDRFSSFQVFSAALSIRAAESLLSSLGEAQGKTDSALKTALAEAKRAFVEGAPRRREETLEELERLTSKAYEAFFEGSTKAESELRTMILDYESFGAHTQEARRLLQIAEQARQSFNVAEYAKRLGDAKQAAENAKSSRTTDIHKSFGIVRSAMLEAKDVGAMLSVGENDLAEAKKAFDDQAFKRAVDLLGSIERAADQAHSEKIRDREVRERQTARVSNTLAGLESALQEARAYGMDVDEGLLFVSSAKRSLADRDLVRAAKLTRHLKDGSKDVEKELDKRRIEHGVAMKVEDAKCGKCGQVSLYSFPGDLKKCVKCGHEFSMTAAPRPATMQAIEEPVSGSGGAAAASQDKGDETKKRSLIRSLKK